MNSKCEEIYNYTKRAYDTLWRNEAAQDLGKRRLKSLYDALERYSRSGDKYFLPQIKDYHINIINLAKYYGDKIEPLKDESFNTL